jgi:hypothetical protein
VVPAQGGLAAVAVAETNRSVSAEALRPAAAQMEARTLALEQREQALRQRERELAEQRRVLAEEYRLMRAQPSPRRVEGSAPAPGGERQGEAGDEVSAGDKVLYPAAASVARFDGVRVESVWERLKRFMLGVSAS